MFPYHQEIKKNIIIASPIILSQVGHVLVGVFDNLMVGQIGANALAAASFANGIFFTFFVFGMGISFAITALTAQYIGSKKHAKLIQLFKHSFWLLLFVGIVLTFLMVGFSAWMPYMGQVEEVSDLAIPYFLIITASVIPYMIFACYKQFAEGFQFTKQAMYITLIANLINIIFNYLLIYGKLGFPQWGLLGAGIATTFSRIVLMLSMIIVVHQNKTLNQFLPKHFFAYLSGKMFKNILKIGLPTGFQSVFEVTAFAFSGVMMGWVSAQTLAAHQIALTIAALTYMFSMGVGASSSVLVGESFGQKNFYALKRNANAGFLLALMGTTFTAFFLIAIHSFIPQWFVSDAVVIAMAQQLLIIAAFFQLSDGIQVVGLSVLRGMGDTKIPSIITFIAFFGIAIPLGYYLAFIANYGAFGIWYGLVIALSIEALLLYARVKYLIKLKSK